MFGSVSEQRGEAQDDHRNPPIRAETGATARVLARAGYDFVVFDVQHAAFDVARAESLLLAVRGTGCAALARVHPGRPDQIEQYLDLGAHGVVVPMVSSASDARRAVGACRYPPAGRRSVGGMRNLLERGADGFLCAKLNEAEALVAAGLTDVMIANQVVGPIKLKRMAELAKRSSLMALLFCRKSRHRLAHSRSLCMEIRIATPSFVVNTP